MAVRPQAGQGAQQGAFACAGGAAQHPALAGGDAPVHHGGEGPPAGAEGLHALQGVAAGGGAALAGDAGGAGRCAAGGLQGGVKFGQARQGRAQQGEVFVFVDEPREGHAHAHEALDELGEVAQGDDAFEQARALQHVGHERADFGVGVVGDGDALGVVHDVAPVAAHGGEAGRKARSFGAFSAVEGDLFGAFADAQQRGAKVGFGLLLAVVDLHHAAADFFNGPRAAQRVDEGHPKHVAGHLQRLAPEGDGQCARQAPDDGREGKEADEVADQPQPQGERAAGDHAQVFGHALVGVFKAAAFALMAAAFALIALIALQPPEGVARQPAAQVFFGHPGAPAHFQRLRQPGAGGVEHQPRERQRGQRGQLRPEGGFVELLERVVEVFLPVGDARGAPHQRQIQRDDGGQQPPARPAVRRDPVGADDGPRARARSGGAHVRRGLKGIRKRSKFKGAKIPLCAVSTRTSCYQ